MRRSSWDRLTVLVGPNASGKSNLLDILRFIKDALRFDLDAAISVRHDLAAIQRQELKGEPSEVELGLAAREAKVGGDRYIMEYDLVLASRHRWRLQGQARICQDMARHAGGTG